MGSTADRYMEAGCAEGPSHPVELVHPPHWRLLHTRGVFNALHATHAQYHDPHLDTTVEWSARKHRKGRRVAIHEDPNKHKVMRRWPRLWGWEFSNISWWVAQLFTWGSVSWCINGWYALFPLEDEARNTRIVGWSALVGGTLFEMGAYCMVVEAVNRGNDVRFGYERGHGVIRKLFRAFFFIGLVVVKNLLESGLTHFHLARGSGYYSHGSGSGREMGTVEDRNAILDKEKGGKPLSGKPCANGAGTSDGATKGDTSGSGGQRWRWWGTRWNNLGYLASFITMIGATIFWVSTIVGVPGVLPDESVHYVEWDILFWLTQVLGSCCFIAAAILFMLETQPSWWRIQPLNLGWQVGFWNLIGGLGFWLSGFFGFWAYPEGVYQKWGTALSTFWGAWAFLLGSYIQLFEMLN